MGYWRCNMLWWSVYWWSKQNYWTAAIIWQDWLNYVVQLVNNRNTIELKHTIFWCENFPNIVQPFGICMYQTIDNLIICNGRKNVKIPKGNQKPPIKGQTILPSQQRGRKDRIVTTTNRTCLWSPVTDTHTLNSSRHTFRW